MAQKYFADRNAKVVARRVNDVRTRLTELKQRQIVKPPRQLAFQGLTAAGPHHRPISAPDEQLLGADNVALTGRLSPTSLSIAAADHVLITGANGVGKSTLLHLLAGHLQPTRGTIYRRANVRIAMLTQESHFANTADKTARTVYAQTIGVELADKVPLATFGLLSARDANRPLANLSIGQQRRLALAVILADPPDVLLLDEPTNHLSLLLVTELEASVEQYPGAIVLASHDRWLRNRWQARHLHL